MLVAPGALPGCGGDSAPPPPPPELSLSIAPTASWCCPGFAPLDASGAPCPLVAIESPGAHYAATDFFSSLDAQALDARTGLAVTIAPPGRCVSVGGPCGHLAVAVTDDEGRALFSVPEKDLQHFGSGSFEFLVSPPEAPPETPPEGPQAKPRRVRVELIGDDGQPLLDPLGAPVAAELSVAVFTARRSRPAQGGETPHEAQPAQSPAEVCPQPGG
ncbi:MAG TPA: hypothetical protein VFS00_09935 [Polyangiaceae bacterium]|nr:hypothetical protein [Polyangiaceae bacterium]